MGGRVVPFSKHSDNLKQVQLDLLALIQRLNGLVTYEALLLDQSWSYGQLSLLMQPLLDAARYQARGIESKLYPHCASVHRNVVKVTEDGSIDYFVIAHSGANTTITPHQVTGVSSVANVTFVDYTLYVGYVKITGAEDAANNGVHELVSGNALGALTVSGLLTENADDETIVIEAYSTG